MKSRVSMDIRGMFSRLIVERNPNTFGYPKVVIRYGGADALLEIEVDEAIRLSNAIQQVISQAEKKACCD